MVTKTSLGENRLWVFVLGVPVEVIHPDAVIIKSVQEALELIDPKLPETGFCRTYPHKPCRQFHFLTTSVNGPRLRMLLDIIFTIQRGKLGKYFEPFLLRPR